MGFLSLLPIKDWIYGGVILALLIGGAIAWHKHDITEQNIGKQMIEAAVKAENTRVTEQNAKDNATKEAADAAQVAQEKQDYEKRLTDANNLTASLNARLRQLSANSAGRSAAVPGQAGSGSGANDSTGISTSAELALEGVITAAGHDADKVTALQAYVDNVCLKPN